MLFNILSENWSLSTSEGVRCQEGGCELFLEQSLDDERYKSLVRVLKVLSGHCLRPVAWLKCPACKEQPHLQYESLNPNYININSYFSLEMGHLKPPVSGYMLLLFCLSKQLHLYNSTLNTLVLE